MDPKRAKVRILVAGLGNSLLCDDGVGVHAVRLLERSPLSIRVRAVEVGCAVFDALPLFERADKILLIDAMRAGGKPGTVYRVEIDNVSDGDVPASLHDLSVVHALRMTKRAGKGEILLVGVEPEVIDYGLDLSPSVEAALPVVIRESREIVSRWIGKRLIRAVPHGALPAAAKGGR